MSQLQVLSLLLRKDPTLASNLPALLRALATTSGHVPAGLPPNPASLALLATRRAVPTTPLASLPTPNPLAFPDSETTSVPSMNRVPLGTAAESESSLLSKGSAGFGDSSKAVSRVPPRNNLTLFGSWSVWQPSGGGSTGLAGDVATSQDSGGASLMSGDSPLAQLLEGSVESGADSSPDAPVDVLRLLELPEQSGSGAAAPPMTLALKRLNGLNEYAAPFVPSVSRPGSGPLAPALATLSLPDSRSDLSAVPSPSGSPQPAVVNSAPPGFGAVRPAPVHPNTVASSASFLGGVPAHPNFPVSSALSPHASASLASANLSGLSSLGGLGLANTASLPNSLPAMSSVSSLAHGLSGLSLNPNLIAANSSGYSGPILSSSHISPGIFGQPSAPLSSQFAHSRFASPASVEAQMIGSQDKDGTSNSHWNQITPQPILHSSFPPAPSAYQYGSMW
eukprot:TRINITY_DN8269_c0_g1_i10.p1 TRINITY_DN8269_c0_g1~~TRINITY_DN8269_c0_g1_i10.p1  ORF type:complete len:451 (+),score=87.36 TRINITY_DN8269_c0_g1_i10:123-1475(+)